MIAVWTWDGIPSLRETDEKIKSFARRGFSAVAADIGEKELTGVVLEALKGCCRSGYRYGIGIYFLLSSYGSVASVPSLRAGVMKDGKQQRSETVLDPFNPVSAGFVHDLILKRISAGLSAFSGKEFKGFILAGPYARLGEGEVPFIDGKEVTAAEAEELCRSSFYAPLEKSCGEKGLALVRQSGCAVLPKDETGNYGEKTALLINSMLKGGGLPLLCPEASLPDSPCSGGDPIFIKPADRLGELMNEGFTDEVTDGVHKITCKENTVIYFAPHAAELEISPPEGYIAAAEDADGSLCGFAGQNVTFSGGGVLILHLSKNPLPCKPLPLFMPWGVKFTKEEGTALPALITEAGENFLPVDKEFSAEYTEGELYFLTKEAEASLNGSPLSLMKTDGGYTAEITGQVRLGANTLSCPGVIYGDLYTDGSCITPPCNVSLGDVSAMGMPFYMGKLTYQVQLPNEIDGERYLILDGAFPMCGVKIGRRTEKLIRPPFAVRLFENDGGRGAEIEIYTGLCKEDLLNENAHKPHSFGLYSAKLV